MCRNSERDTLRRNRSVNSRFYTKEEPEPLNTPPHTNILTHISMHTYHRNSDTSVCTGAHTSIHTYTLMHTHTHADTQWSSYSDTAPMGYSLEAGCPTTLPSSFISGSWFKKRSHCFFM